MSANEKTTPAGTEVENKTIKIGDKEFSEITVATTNDEVVAIITDTEIVEAKGFKVILT